MQAERLARQVADQQNAALASIPPGMYVLTVSQVSPLLVEWRGRTVNVAGKDIGYTPVVGHRVHCSVIDSQLFIDYRIG